MTLGSMVKVKYFNICLKLWLVTQTPLTDLMEENHIWHNKNQNVYGV